MTRKFVTFLLVVLCFSNLLFSESFRVRKVVINDWNNEAETQNISLGMMEALNIRLPEELLFMKAIEMKIVLPANLAEYGTAVAYTFYTNVNPEPKEGLIDYSATKFNIDTFAYQKNYHFTIPLEKDYVISKDPFTKYINLPLDEPLRDIFLRVHIVMKGVPDGLYDSTIDIELKPVLNNKGLLDMTILYPENNTKLAEKHPYAIFIDEKPIDINQTKMLLDTGTHHFSINSEHYRSEMQTFTIERAEQTDLHIQLQDIAPVLEISAPEHTKFYLNSELYEDYSMPIVVEPGTHTIRFLIGDYEVIKSIDVINGRTYAVELSFDVVVTEE